MKITLEPDTGEDFESRILEAVSCLGLIATHQPPGGAQITYTHTHGTTAAVADLVALYANRLNRAALMAALASVPLPEDS